jgi:hypothetical protein
MHGGDQRKNGAGQKEQSAEKRNAGKGRRLLLLRYFLFR